MKKCLFRIAALLVIGGLLFSSVAVASKKKDKNNTEEKIARLTDDISQLQVDLEWAPLEERAAIESQILTLQEKLAKELTK